MNIKLPEVLQPGLYLRTTKSFKQLDGGGIVLQGSMLNETADRPSVRTLAQEVGWLAVALKERRNGIAEIAYEIRRNNEDVIDELPFVFDWKRESQRIDTALQVHGVAYMRKQFSGGRLVGLRWLEPMAVRPDVNTAYTRPGGAGYHWYVYDHDRGHDTIPDEELLIWHGFSLSELGATSMVDSTRLAAEILRGIDEATETIFDNNALPPLLVKVSPHTQEAEMLRFENVISRFFNRKDRTRKRPVRAMTNDVEIQPLLGLNNHEMKTIELGRDKINQLLAAHDIPPSRVFDDASNLAVALNSTARFISVLGARLKAIADVINTDETIAAIGVEIVPLVDAHPSQKRDEERASRAILNYVGAGMTGEAALYYVTGDLISVFPQELQGNIFVDATMIGNADVSVETDEAEDELDELNREETKSAAWLMDAKAFKNWYRKRMGTDVTQFNSNDLSHSDKLLIADEILRHSIKNYP